MHGAKAIEDYRSYEQCGDACDVVISRNEHDDDAPLTYRKVLRKFERWSLVMELQIGGRVIGTTAEHPYFVRGKGWTATHDLQPGDEVRLMAPGWKTIENVIATDRLEKVYNLEIEEDHTYFVGCDEWGWAVWAHNATNYDIYEQGGGKWSVRYKETPATPTKWAVDANGDIIHFTKGDADAWVTAHQAASTGNPVVGGFTQAQLDGFAAVYAGSRNTQGWKWETFAQSIGVDLTQLTKPVRSAIRNTAESGGQVSRATVDARGVADFTGSTTRILGRDGVDHGMTVFVPETIGLKYKSHFGHMDGKFQRPSTHLWDHMPTDGMFQLVERKVHALTSHKGYELWSKKV